MSKIQKIFVLLVAFVLALGSAVAAPTPVQAAERSGQPAINILKTVRDASVTVEIWGFAADTVDVFMGTAGSGAVKGIKVATLKFGKLNVVKETLSIPAQLKGSGQIDIRVQGSRRRSVSDWFYNMTSGPGGYSEVPSLSVKGYVYKKTVTVTAINLAPGAKYGVLMGTIRDGRKFYTVGSFTSNVGGTLSQTFTLPSQLQNTKQIYVILQNVARPCNELSLTSSCLVYTMFYHIRN